MDSVRLLGWKFAGLTLALMGLAVVLWLPWRHSEPPGGQERGTGGAEPALPAKSEDRGRTPAGDRQQAVSPTASGYLEFVDVESMEPVSKLSLGMRSSAGSVAVESDAAGIVEIPSGPWELALAEDSGYRVGTMDVVVTAGATSTVFVSKFGLLKLHVLDPSGSVVQGAHLTVHQTCDGLLQGLGFAWERSDTFATDADGIVEFMRMGAADCRVLIHAVGYLPLEVSLAPPSGTRDVRVRVARSTGGTIQLQVVDLDQSPLEGVTIAVSRPGFRGEVSLGVTNEWGSLEVPDWVRECPEMYFEGTAFPSRARRSDERVGDVIRVQVPRAVRGCFVARGDRDLRGMRGTVEGENDSALGVATVQLQDLQIEPGVGEQAVCTLPAKMKVCARLRSADGRAWVGTIQVDANGWVVPADMSSGPLAGGRRGVKLRSTSAIEKVELTAGSSPEGPIPGVILDQGACVARFSVGHEESWLRISRVGAPVVLVSLDVGKEDLDIPLLDARLMDVQLPCRDSRGRVVRDVMVQMQRVGDAWSAGSDGVKQMLSGGTRTAIPDRTGMASARLLPGRYLVRAIHTSGRVRLEGSMAVVPKMIEIAGEPVRVDLVVPRPRRCVLELTRGAPAGEWLVREPATGAVLRGAGESFEFWATDRNHSLEWVSPDGLRKPFDLPAGDESVVVQLN